MQFQIMEEAGAINQTLHNVLRSSNVVVVGQILFCHQPNFANDCNGLSYDG